MSLSPLDSDRFSQAIESNRVNPEDLISAALESLEQALEAFGPITERIERLVHQNPDLCPDEQVIGHIVQKLEEIESCVSNISPVPEL